MFKLFSPPATLTSTLLLGVQRMMARRLTDPDPSHGKHLSMGYESDSDDGGDMYHVPKNRPCSFSFTLIFSHSHFLVAQSQHGINLTTKERRVNICQTGRATKIAPR